jgi:hypothetical protein
MKGEFAGLGRVRGSESPMELRRLWWMRWEGDLRESSGKLDAWMDVRESALVRKKLGGGAVSAASAIQCKQRCAAVQGRGWRIGQSHRAVTILSERARPGRHESCPQALAVAPNSGAVQRLERLQF